MSNSEGGNREMLKSRFGFLMVAAGCAVGLGNVWRFPFVVGQNGGAAFVLVYLFFLLVFGFPLLVAELAIGRGAKKGIASAFASLAPTHNAKKWGTLGSCIFVGSFILMIYYTDVAGWLLKYAGDYACGINMADDTGAAFTKMLSNSQMCTSFMALAVGIATVVCLAGVVKGVERVTKVMMGSLLALLVVLAVKSVSLPGAVEGLKFYLNPDWSKIMQHPVTSGFEAMGQAFFTLSVGVGAMTTFGSYIGKKHSLVKESVLIIAIDTVVALLSGFIVFPACAAYHVEYTAGPGLIFVALPKVFQAMPGGRIWGFCFFLFLSFAALTTIIAMFECIISGILDSWKMSRVVVTSLVGCAVAVCSLPCIFIDGVLDWEDFVVSQLWLPIGGLSMCIFVTRKFGWGWDAFRLEASSGRGLKLPEWMNTWFSYVIPLFIVTILIGGLVLKFSH